MLSNASQVGVPALARASTTFQTIDIDIPSVDIQKKIVDVLETIREKIELNNHIQQLQDKNNKLQNWILEAKNLNSEGLGIAADECNIKATKLYKSLGFVKEGEKDFEYAYLEIYGLYF